MSQWAKQKCPPQQHTTDITSTGIFSPSADDDRVTLECLAAFQVVSSGEHALLLTQLRSLPFQSTKEGKIKKKIFPAAPRRGPRALLRRLIKCCQSQRAPRKQSRVCLCVTERRRLWLPPNSRTFRWGYKSRGTPSQVAASALRRNLTLQWRLLWTAIFFFFLWRCCRNLLLTLAVKWSVSLCDSRRGAGGGLKNVLKGTL